MTTFSRHWGRPHPFIFVFTCAGKTCNLMAGRNKQGKCYIHKSVFTSLKAHYIHFQKTTTSMKNKLSSVSREHSRWKRAFIH